MFIRHINVSYVSHKCVICIVFVNTIPSHLILLSLIDVSLLQESLLAGSLPSFAAHPVDGFTADISASGLVSSKRVRLPVAVKYYKIPGNPLL